MTVFTVAYMSLDPRIILANVWKFLKAIGNVWNIGLNIWFMLRLSFGEGIFDRIFQRCDHYKSRCFHHIRRFYNTIRSLQTRLRRQDQQIGSN
jgi:hypothetical protein